VFEVLGSFVAATLFSAFITVAWDAWISFPCVCAIGYGEGGGWYS
jgi:hypothetical protein